MEFNVNYLAIAGVAFIAFITLGLILSRLYLRASKEVSFVRTGFRGQKVIVNGGALVLPVLHEVIPVNMNTLRLDVRRNRDQALITRDRMRVDVAAEFYVRVKPVEESIANAAQTLGKKTMQPESLKELVEGKFVDALRSVAAEMAMEELHEQRTAFVQKVQQVVTEDLLKNGLELETVSLTGLDQTSKEFFNPDNAFDAEGLTKLTEAIEARRKTRNDIEQDTQVEIERKNLSAVQQTLEIKREEEYARLQQEREVEIRRASQEAEIAAQRAAKRREAEQAQISAQQLIDQSEIESSRAVEEQRIVKDQLLREREIEKERALETANVDRQKTIELAEQSRAIAIAEKSKEQSLSEREADLAKAEAVKAAELVITAKEAERAEREKLIELIQAAKEAERDMIDTTTEARAKKQAAEDQAEAIRTLAMAEADRIRINAEAEATAEKERAAAAEQRYKVDAEGQAALNEAANRLSIDQITMQVKLAIIQQLPEIIRQSVKPMEHIDGIKIIQVDGLSGGNSIASDGTGSNEGGSLADQVVNSALRYKAQAPLVESILNDVGLSGHSLEGLVKIATQDTTKATPAKPAKADKKND